MSGISKRRQLFINSLKLLIPIITIYYFIGLLSSPRNPKNIYHEFRAVANLLQSNSSYNGSSSEQMQNFTNISSGKFVCWVNYTCVYSAYYDDITENQPIIRLVGIDNPNNTWDSLECFYFHGNRTLLGQPYPGRKVKAVADWNNKCEHSVMFFFCDLDIISDVATPTYVWLSVNGSGPSLDDVQGQLLQIHYPPLEKYRYKVAACVQPLHSMLNNVLQVLEWIEYLRLIGVEHFTFYNYKGGPHVLQLLESYGPDVVTVLNWDIPVVKGIHVNGQFVAASDCTYRHRGVAKYVLAFDTDEFLILPEGYENVYEYLETMWDTNEANTTKIINSIIFNSKFSFLNWPANNSLVPAVNPAYLGVQGVLNQLNLPARANFLPAKQTKFVYKPEFVEESGVHWIDKGVAGTISIHPSVDAAYYFHFRRCWAPFTQANRILLNKATCEQAEGIETDLYPALTFGSKLMDAVAKKIYWSKELMNLLNVTRDSDI